MDSLCVILTIADFFRLRHIAAAQSIVQKLSEVCVDVMLQVHFQTASASVDGQKQCDAFLPRAPVDSAH